MNTLERLNAAQEQWRAMMNLELGTVTQDDLIPSATFDALMALPAKLTELRKGRNLTIAALSEGSGVGYSTIWRMEQMSPQPRPNLENVLLLAEFFGVPLSELLSFDVALAEQRQAAAPDNQISTNADAPETPEVGALLARLQEIIDQLGARNIAATVTMTVRGTRSEEGTT